MIPSNASSSLIQETGHDTDAMTAETAQWKHALNEERRRHAVLLEQCQSALHARTQLLEKRNGDIDQIRREYEGRSHELGALTARLLERDRAFDAQSEELVKKTEQVANLKSQLDALRASLAEKEAELDRVYQSHSYRVTAPMRWLRGLFRLNR